MLGDINEDCPIRDSEIQFRMPGIFLARDSLVNAEPNGIFVVIQVRNQTVAMLHCAYQLSSMFSG